MRRRMMIGAICLVAGCQSMRSNTARFETAVPSLPVESQKVPVAEAKPAVAEAKPDVPKVEDRIVVAQPTARNKSEDSAAVDHLMRAADCMERNDTANAAEHLRRHVAACPDQIMIRAYLAEILYKTGEFDEARWQFERFTADAQSVDGPANDHLLHCHSRLMEIAENRDEGGAEYLHRGIGLYLLACRSLKQEAAVEENLPERLFLKATVELKAAQKLLPSDARPCWYLHLAWAKLNQLEPARLALDQARELAETSSMTPVEKQNLRATAQAAR